MAQNRSSAVMQQRIEAPDSLDDFPTPPWATRALLEWLRNNGHGQHFAIESCREPCANRGFMVAPLREAFGDVRASDVFDYGCGFDVRDFLFGLLADWTPVDHTFANPPFRLAEQFIRRALATSRKGVFMLVRTSFSEGQERYRSLFSDMAPTIELVFSERVVMLKGRLIQAGEPDPFAIDDDGNPRKASTATSYVWLGWMRDEAGGWDHDTRKRWLAPCRLRLERPGDYPSYEPAAVAA